MNYLKLSIIALIMTTVLICLLNPRLHKRVVIGDVNVTVISQQEPVQKPSNFVEANKQPQDVRKEFKPINPNVILPKQQKKVDNAVATVQPQKKLTNNIQQIQPKPQTQIKQQQKQMTAEEAEIIAWNKWRSDLQNKVMKDTKIRAPIGTVFKFSFTVDREGTISNLKTWALNPDYTPMAVHVIKPTILSYQGQSILNFPPESKRVITNVNGGFTVWYSAGYSSPSDYSDYERVK